MSVHTPTQGWPGGGVYPSMPLGSVTTLPLTAATASPIQTLGERKGSVRWWLWLSDPSATVQVWFQSTNLLADRPATTAWPHVWLPGAWSGGENLGAFTFWLSNAHRFVSLLSSTSQNVHHAIELPGSAAFLIDDVTGDQLVDEITGQRLVDA